MEISTASSTRIHLEADPRTRLSIAILILNWNQKDATAECLNSLKLVRKPKFTIVVVDNGSQDGSAPQLGRLFPEVQIIRNSENLGFAEGNNVGIQAALEAGADYILMLNNDTVVAPNFLEELVSAAERNPQAGIVGGRVVYYDRPDTLWCFGGYLHLPTARMSTIKKDVQNVFLEFTECEFDYISGALMLVRAELFRQIGFFDSTFFLNWEDTDFCRRARNAGWKVIAVSTARVMHKVSAATAGKMVTYFTQRNRLAFARKHTPRWQFYSITVPYHLIRLLTKSLRWMIQRRTELVFAGWLGTLDFFRGRLGKGSWPKLQGA